MRVLFLPLEFWNYTDHPMRMSDVILPGHTFPGTIKGSAFPFLLGGSKVKPADTRLTISLSTPGRFHQQTEGPFYSREHISTFVPLVPLGDYLLINYVSLLKQMDPEGCGWVQNSRTAIYNCLTNFFDSRHKGKLPLKLSLKYKIENHQYQRLHYLFSFFW